MAVAPCNSYMKCILAVKVTVKWESFLEKIIKRRRTLTEQVRSKLRIGLHTQTNTQVYGSFRCVTQKL